MANPFDQFDAAPASASNAASANPFDQFDAAPAPARPLTIMPAMTSASAPAKPSWLDIAKDVGQSAATGIERGAIGIAGLPADLSTLGDRAMNAGVNKARAWLGKDPLPSNAGDSGDPVNYLGSGAITKGVEAVAGPMYQPGTAAGRYAETVGTFVPGAGRSLGAMATHALLPGVASEAAGQATEGTPAEPYARGVAAILAPGAVAAGRRAITPMSIDPAHAAAVDTLRREGVTDLSAGQITGSKNLQRLESVASQVPLGTGRFTAMGNAQKSQFTGAAMRRMGSDADTAAPEAFTPARAAIGAKFDDLASRNTMQMDNGLWQDFGKVAHDYDRLLPEAQKPIVAGYISDIVDHGMQNNGTMAGDVYQANRSKIDAAARGYQNSDPHLATALRGVRDALDNNMARSMTPADNAAWQNARREWAASKVIEKASTGAGENAALGNISPGALRSAAVTGRRGQYAQGSGMFDDLARAGNAVMTPLGDSGTAGRQAINNILYGSGGLIAGSALGAVTAAKAAAVPIAASHVIGSRPVQRYLANQALPAGPALSAADRFRLLAFKANAVRASIGN